MPSLVETTLDRLIDRAIKGGAGSRFPAQDDLAVKLQVSRTVLREALVTLEYLGVISVKPKIGTTVNAWPEWKVRNDDVVEWRKRAAAMNGAQS